MKKKILKVVLILIILMLAIFTVKVDAAYRSTDPTVESGGTFTITITSTDKIENFEIELVGYSGLTYLKECTGVDGSVVSNKETGKMTGASINGYTTLGTYTFQAPEVTEKKTYIVSFNINDTTNTSTVTVNPKQVQQPQQPENQAPQQPEKPKVTSVQGKYSEVNETVYAINDVNIRKYDSTEEGSTVLKSLKKGEQIVRTGVSSNGWSRVQYNGGSAYISSQYLKVAQKQEEPQNNTNTVANTVTNEITNTITNEVGIIDEEFDDLAILKLKSLKIKGADISSVFSPDIYEYKINIETANKLEIEAIANQKDAKVEILGNEDFKEGENLVTIILKSADASQTCTYQIIVNVGKVTEQIQNNNNGNDIVHIILYVIVGLIVIVIIAIVVLKLKSRNSDEEFEYNDESGIFNYDKEVGIEEEENENKRKKGKHF